MKDIKISRIIVLLLILLPFFFLVLFLGLDFCSYESCKSYERRIRSEVRKELSEGKAEQEKLIAEVVEEVSEKKGKVDELDVDDTQNEVKEQEFDLENKTLDKEIITGDISWRGYKSDETYNESRNETEYTYEIFRETNENLELIGTFSEGFFGSTVESFENDLGGITIESYYGAPEGFILENYIYDDSGKISLAIKYWRPADANISIEFNGNKYQVATITEENCEGFNSPETSLDRLITGVRVQDLETDKIKDYFLEKDETVETVCDVYDAYLLPPDLKLVSYDTDEIILEIDGGKQVIMKLNKSGGDSLFSDVEFIN